MVTLAKRATPAQYRILRIVAGAVKNAGDAHPELKITPRFARSVAKRAAGTLSAQWPEVLAAKALPVGADAENCRTARPSGSKCMKAAKRGPTQRPSRSPLRLAHNRLGAMAAFARKAGHSARAAAFADALRVLANIDAECQ